MKFLKDFFYIHHHERRALLVILTLLVGSTTMIFIVGSKETMPSEKQQAHNDSIIRHATRQQPGYYVTGMVYPRCCRNKQLHVYLGYGRGKPRLRRHGQDQIYRNALTVAYSCSCI